MQEPNENQTENLPTNKIICGNNVDVLASLPEQCVQMCVTSPPYWGLRDYGNDKQLGLEKTPEEYVANMVKVFQAVGRVLRDDGTLWLNLGDTYWGGKGQSGSGGKEYQQLRSAGGVSFSSPEAHVGGQGKTKPQDGKHSVLKGKDLIGIPWRVAFALQQDGWYLRQDIIWHKPNPMPESVTDRCTKAHEYIFLLTKQPKYYYDADAIKEPLKYPKETRRPLGSDGAWKLDGREQGENGGGKAYGGYPKKRNKRSVWSVTVKSFAGAHFATFPPDLIEPCILAGSNEGNIVLDPFNGAGTTCLVAGDHNRKFIGIDCSEEYCEIARKRLSYDIDIAEAAQNLSLDDFSDIII